MASKRPARILAVVMLAVAVLLLGGWLALDIASPPNAAPGAAGDDESSTIRRAPPSDRRAGGSYRPSRPGEWVSASVQVDPAAGAGVLEGQVLSWETNEPVTGAELTFARGEVLSSTDTDLAGGFSFRASQPGTYELVSVTAEGFLPFAPEWGHSPISLEAHPERRIRDIVIHLHPAVDYEGLVVDGADRPVVGAEVTILSAREGQTALEPLSERFISGEGGRFRFQAPFNALLEARHRDHAPGRARLDRIAQFHKRVTVKLGPRTDGAAEGELSSIGGLVVDANGRAVAGALVVARFVGRGRHLRTSSQALTDEEGGFIVEGLDPGRYYVTASADGWVPAAARAVQTGRDDLRLELSAGATIEGVVFDQNGEPVPGFSVILQTRRNALQLSTYLTETFFDADGRFEIRGVAPGTYSLYATSQGYARSASEEVPLRDAAGSVAVELTLSRGGAASGVVVDGETRRPISDAQVALEVPPGQDSAPVPLTARTVTDFNGRFEIKGLAPGRRSLAVFADGYHRRLITGLEVSEEATLDAIVVELTRAEEGEDPSFELTGIGAVLSPRPTELVIVRLLEGSGAAEVGLAPGDAILWVEGQPVTDLGFTGSIELIRGPEGTAVRLSVRRANGEELEVTVPRRRVRG